MNFSFFFLKISTINEYWKWLENSFVSKLRAQKWYNDEIPRHLTGFINNKSNRLIGWVTMRQLHIKSELCHNKKIISICQHDYNLFDEEKRSFRPRWIINQTTQIYSSTIHRAFQYKSNKELDTYIYIGGHGSYDGGGGYVYKFRGRLSDLKSNLS